jgi:hypothetical protein
MPALAGAPQAAAAAARTLASMSSLRAWKIGALCGIVYRSTANRRPGAPRLGWPGGCPMAPPMACPRHVAPPHPAVLAHVSRGASRFSCARPARGGAHVGKAMPCSLGAARRDTTTSSDDTDDATDDGTTARRKNSIPPAQLCSLVECRLRPA